MARKIFTYIFPSSLLIILLSLGIITCLFSVIFKKYYLETTREMLRTNARSMSLSIAEVLPGKNNPRLRGLIKTFTDKTTFRITVISNEGLVLADSSRNPDEMENHASPERREIIEALKGRTGDSIRYSSTLRTDAMYVAIPLEKNGQVTAVIRTSISLKAIDRYLNETYKRIFGFAILVAVIAIFVSFIISKKISTPLERLKITAAEFAKSNFESIPPSSNILEIRELSESMKTMSKSLQSNINEISQQKNELKSILSTMREGVIAIDLSDQIITVNDAAQKILNTNFDVSGSLENQMSMNLDTDKKSSGLLYTDNTSFKQSVRNQEIQSFVKEVLDSGSSMERKIEFMDLKPKVISAHGAVLRDHASSMVGVLLVVNDITQITQLEKMRANFAANVSHELKTPLTAIKGAVETLIDGAMDSREEATKFLGIIEKHSERLNALINDIMSLSKIEQDNDQAATTLAIGMLRPIIDTSIEMCREKAEKNNVSIEVSCDDVLQAAVNAPMLEQALVNLIDNAIKYSPANDTITVTASQINNNIKISVKDHGCGIPQKHFARIFERFYRVDKGRSRQQGGTGLGLAIVKHIVQSHDGSIDVESVLGKGSAFTITIPT